MNTRTITLPTEQWKTILEAVQDCWDEGPVGWGWQGSQLSAASAALSTALSQPEPEGAAQRIRKFITEFGKMRGLHPEVVYEIHAGDDHRQASITIADLEALLSQPEPQGVTDEELDDLANEMLDWNCEGWRTYARAAIAADRARWGRTAIESVPVPAPMSADTLAAIIREVDGTHRLGAAALAEAILSHPGSRWSPAIKPVPVTERPALAEQAYVAFVQICKGNSDDAGTYDADEELVRRALKKLRDLECNALPAPGAEVGQP